MSHEELGMKVSHPAGSATADIEPSGALQAPVAAEGLYLVAAEFRFR